MATDPRQIAKTQDTRAEAECYAGSCISVSANANTATFGGYSRIEKPLSDFMGKFS